ncbi:helix-turn-helix domain-containing protein [Dinghuibacter silviterrae]|uniref:AraC family transcriptional regulator n=1 Tax=Dinghuibacter silviterrae TaxID=1539049 RepID=A0A4R8DMW2_9BACT|nr:helix-turn-helix transcriptional regulator [Dinghuibacter silviterrae]TDW99118.1 AraC family transcriptional regulator [Dinghuibacter silviterrae]
MVIRLQTISQYHRLMGLPKPEHPLVSVVRFEDIKGDNEPKHFLIDYYCIALKRNFNGKIKYGQQDYDFDEGIMTFMAPGQVFRIEVDKDQMLQHSGWMLLVHPDFLWNTPMAKAIRQYDFFDYSVNEALFLSDKEESTIIGIMQNIGQEYQSNIDKYSQNIILAQLDLLLTYSERFYQRQFITRKITNHKILDRLENLLSEYFDSESLTENGLPSVQYIAGELHLSPSYLGDLLKTLTGQNTQQHIHEKLIEKAKEKLSTTDLSISEIAFQLGFVHSQSFSKLFKAKTNQTPLAFRQSFS